MPDLQGKPTYPPDDCPVCQGRQKKKAAAQVAYQEKLLKAQKEGQKAVDALVAAGAKGFRARAGQDYNARSRIITRVMKTEFHLEKRLRTEGVADFRAVDGDFGDPARLLVDDVFVLLDEFPFHRSAPEKASGCSTWITWPQSSRRRSECGSSRFILVAMPVNFASRVPASTTTGIRRRWSSFQ